MERLAPSESSSRRRGATRTEILIRPIAAEKSPSEQRSVLRGTVSRPEISSQRPLLLLADALP